jgi:hypothetical protein
VRATQFMYCNGACMESKMRASRISVSMTTEQAMPALKQQSAMLQA